ncbi:hypothetical protein [Micromonospora phaseoli]|nr:hypothetical protein [Micromonospora phaseoli]GIJ75589.1 hypothetical protein Xph01_00210 [Micromonospora phaseoli]
MGEEEGVLLSERGSTRAMATARRLAPRLAARAAAHDRDGSFPADDSLGIAAVGGDPDRDGSTPRW